MKCVLLLETRIPEKYFGLTVCAFEARVLESTAARAIS